MLLILFWVSVLMFNFSYLFSVLFLACLVLSLMMIYFANMMYLKYLIILVYISGIVVFILYISCMCWFVSDKFNNYFLFFSLFCFFIYDLGMFSKFSDIGEYLWMYLFFSFLFNSLVMGYSMNLFKVSGSLRF